MHDRFDSMLLKNNNSTSNNRINIASYINENNPNIPPNRSAAEKQQQLLAFPSTSERAHLMQQSSQTMEISFKSDNILESSPTTPIPRVKTLMNPQFSSASPIDFSNHPNRLTTFVHQPKLQHHQSPQNHAKKFNVDSAMHPHAATQMIRSQSNIHSANQQQQQQQHQQSNVGNSNSLSTTACNFSTSRNAISDKQLQHYQSQNTLRPSTNYAYKPSQTPTLINNLILGSNSLRASSNSNINNNNNNNNINVINNLSHATSMNNIMNSNNNMNSYLVVNVNQNSQIDSAGIQKTSQFEQQVHRKANLETRTHDELSRMTSFLKKERLKSQRFMKRTQRIADRINSELDNEKMKPSSTLNSDVVKSDSTQQTPAAASVDNGLSSKRSPSKQRQIKQQQQQQQQNSRLNNTGGVDSHTLNSINAHFYEPSELKKCMEETLRAKEVKNLMDKIQFERLKQTVQQTATKIKALKSDGIYEFQYLKDHMKDEDCLVKPLSVLLQFNVRPPQNEAERKAAMKIEHRRLRQAISQEVKIRNPVTIDFFTNGNNGDASAASSRIGSLAVIHHNNNNHEKGGDDDETTGRFGLDPAVIIKAAREEQEKVRGRESIAQQQQSQKMIAFTDRSRAGGTMSAIPKKQKSVPVMIAVKEPRKMMHGGTEREYVNPLGFRVRVQELPPRVQSAAMFRAKRIEKNALRESLSRERRIREHK